ncbi:vanadium-dependent haloperoxidase [Sorangium sp. So ce406]|uniref:vanadium-dependent haloperoxidase n=1 Tax=Sorangium sp. So ce406 TaxID=3133311 RepID=UPI003F5C7362
MAARKRRGLLAATLAVAALSWSEDARANQEVRDWNTVMAQMEPLTGFFMASRLSALLHVAIHDALNSVPETARYHTYLPPVHTEEPASPEAALAAAGRTVLATYIDFYANQSLPPEFSNPGLADLLPMVETLYDTQLAAIPDGPEKTEGIRIGEAAAINLWNERLGDGWNNPDGLEFEFLDNDGDDNPMTGLPGEYVMLDPADTFPGTSQPFFFWWGAMTPWTMESNDQFLCAPPPNPRNGAFRRDMEETRAYGAVDSAVRTPQQSFEALWWEACDGFVFSGTYAFTRQLVTDFELDNYEAARVFALALLTQADAMISNVNSKNFYHFWRPITAINHYHPGSDWKPLMTTSPNQEYPAGHPMVSGATLYALMEFFGGGRLDEPLVGTNTCGDIVFSSLKDAVEGVINARVWGGIHYRGSGEVGARTGRKIARYVHRNFLEPL